MMARPASSYRGRRRNAEFGRKPVGNTTPEERREIWRKLGAKVAKKRQRL